MLDRRADLTPGRQLAVLLEDAIDIHDRHWKIHWMLNFAQLSATLNLRAVMEETHGRVDEALLGRLQNSASDRNWDKIRALWEMKEEVEGRPASSPRRSPVAAAEIVPGAPGAPSAAAGSSTSASSPTSRSSAGTPSGATSSSSRPSASSMEPVIQLVRDQSRATTTTRPKVAALAADIDAAAAEILEGLEGEALEEMRAAIEINLRMAPLTPDHHFYIDQGANAHVRLVLIAIGEKLVELGVLEPPDDVVFLPLQRAAGVHRRPAGRPAGARSSRRPAPRANAAYTVQPRDWVGTVTETQLAFPYLSNWGFPDKFHRGQGEAGSEITGVGRVAGRRRGRRAGRAHRGRVRRGPAGRHPRVPDDQPGLAGAVRPKIAALVTDAGGVDGHPAVLAREYEIPAVVGTSVATAADQDRRPDPGRRQRRRRSTILEARRAPRRPRRPMD